MILKKKRIYIYQVINFACLNMKMSNQNLFKKTKTKFFLRFIYIYIYIYIDLYIDIYIFFDMYIDIYIYIYIIDI